MKVLLFVLSLAALPVFAQSYPAKPVRLVVPFPAGSATDQVARLVGSQLQEALAPAVRRGEQGRRTGRHRRRGSG